MSDEQTTMGRNEQRLRERMSRFGPKVVEEIMTKAQRMVTDGTMRPGSTLEDACSLLLSMTPEANDQPTDMRAGHDHLGSIVEGNDEDHEDDVFIEELAREPYAELFYSLGHETVAYNESQAAVMVTSHGVNDLAVYRLPVDTMTTFAVRWLEAQGYNVARVGSEDDPMTLIHAALSKARDDVRSAAADREAFPHDRSVLELAQEESQRAQGQVTALQALMDDLTDHGWRTE